MWTAAIWSKSKPEVVRYGWRFGRIQWHVIPEPHAALWGAATWRIQWHDPRATCHIAGCCHLTNSMSWSKSHVSHCRVLLLGEFDDMPSQIHVSPCMVLTPGEFNVMIPEPLATLQGAANLKILCHVIPELRATLQGAATWRIHWYDLRATYHIAGWINSIRRIENRFSPYFVFLFSKMQFGLRQAAAFASSSIILFWH